ncbi:nitroreductase [Pseudenhygromyxa sp. WMMC2535]|uniref:Acg family FMN-binding oxidoreductase n=1 Tax=Pseudenhygromyxa sp. WMMC2535 TaxID=2712867 RepID=UPI001556E6CE|nr:nitroreductase [Pseudenhygromyxa sp. WMMC2535]NVB39407.1 nitroreductase [Pseudenhygromyxa sp. WMMC2535]
MIDGSRKTRGPAGAEHLLTNIERSPSGARGPTASSGARSSLGGVSRRIFVCGASAGLAAAALGCAPGATRQSLSPQPPPKGVDPALVEILRLAALAPSGHNAQPWFVAIEGMNLSIQRDESCELPAVDPQNRELALSVGAFIENLSLAAGAAGFTAEIEIVGQDPKEDHELARVSLIPSEASGYNLERLEQRRTLRKGHLDRPLDNTTLAALTGPLDHFAFFPADSAEGRRLAELTYGANEQQTWRDDAQRELAMWMRLADEEVEAQRDGLTPEGMEIHGIAGAVVRRYDNEDVMSKRFRERSLKMVREQLDAYGGWLVIRGLSGLEGLIQTGRQWQRSFLLARELGVAFHPMTQALEEKGYVDLVLEEFGGSGGWPQFLLRTSFVAPEDYAAPVSPRKPVAWFVDVVER